MPGAGWFLERSRFGRGIKSCQAADATSDRDTTRLSIQLRSMNARRCVCARARAHVRTPLINNTVMQRARRTVDISIAPQYSRTPMNRSR